MSSRIISSRTVSRSIKKGQEFYQITLGGSAHADETDGVALGDRLGAAIEKAAVADTIADLLSVYVEQRTEAERFIDTYRRIGIRPFKERVYGQPAAKEAA